MSNPINPEHYKSTGFECIEVMESVFGKTAVYWFCVLNAFKYLFRHRNKNGVEDLRKCLWYVNKAVEKYEDA